MTEVVATALPTGLRRGLGCGYASSVTLRDGWSRLGRRRGALAGVAVAAAIGCGGGTSASEVDAKAKADASAKADDARAKPAPKPTKVEPPPAPTASLPKVLATMAEAEAQAKEIWAGHRKTFDCGCSYSAQMKTVRATCGYKTRANEELAHRVDIALVVPANVFGAHRECWTSELCVRDDGSRFGGVECCRQRDPVFGAMERDLHNLVPMIGELAADRSDFPYGEIKGEPRLYGLCDVEVDAQAKVVEPLPELRGDIARIYLYMQHVYGPASGMQLDPALEALYERWHAEDPPDAWEHAREDAIAAIQGVRNDMLGPPPAGDAPPPGAKAPADAKAPTKAPGKLKPPHAPIDPAKTG